MISKDNEIAKKLQTKHGSTFAKNFSIFTLRENMNWNNNKKGALNLFDSSAKGMHNVDQKQELA